MLFPPSFLLLFHLLASTSAFSALPTATSTRFQAAQTNRAFTTPVPAYNPQTPLLNFLRRQDPNCPAAHTGCSGYGVPNVCCSTNAACTVDGDNHIACCPFGASCTGTIGPAASGDSAAQSAASPPAAGVTGSTVPNSYFRWVYAPSTFSNNGDCSSFAAFCSAEYSSCTASLGGGNGVTITGVGVSITQVQVGTASAAAICSSLSSQACYASQLSTCAGAATGTLDTGGTLTIESAGMAPRRGCDGVYIAMGAGVAVGILGGFVQ